MSIFSFIEQHMDLISFLMTVVGGVFALYQWRLSVKNGQAEYVDKLLERFQSDDEIRDFISKNDYEEDWYNKEFHNFDSDRNIAIKADKTLFFLDYLCHIKQEKILHKKEFAVFEYNLYAVIQNINTQSYFADLYQYSLVENRKFPFIHVLEYGIKNKIIPREIIDNNYIKYMFMIESGMDNVPEIYRELYSTVGKKRFLFIYSRCENCIHFDSCNQVCKADCDYKTYYWGLSDNLCLKFSIDMENWDKNKNNTSYHELKKNNY